MTTKLYANVIRLFQLPKPDQRHVCFVVSLDPPIKQGQTRYAHLIMQFPKDETLDVPLNFESEEQMKEKFPDLGPNVKGYAYDVVSKIFKILTGKKITLPDTFKSHGNACAIKCSLKANDGFLYPLEGSFFFIHKPSTHIHFTEIANIEFARVSTSDDKSTNRTFDLVVTLQNNNIFQFTGIQRQEYSPLFEFITSKKITIKTQHGNVTEMDMDDKASERIEYHAQNPEDEDEEEEDEDFEIEEDDEVPEEYDEHYEHPLSDEEPGTSTNEKSHAKSSASFKEEKVEKKTVNDSAKRKSQENSKSEKKEKKAQEIKER